MLYVYFSGVHERYAVFHESPFFLVVFKSAARLFTCFLFFYGVHEVASLSFTDYSCIGLFLSALMRAPPF